MSKDIHIHGYIDEEIKEYDWSPVSASDIVKWREASIKLDAVRHCVEVNRFYLIRPYELRQILDFDLSEFNQKDDKNV